MIRHQLILGYFIGMLNISNKNELGLKLCLYANPITMHLLILYKWRACCPVTKGSGQVGSLQLSKIHYVLVNLLFLSCLRQRKCSHLFIAWFTRGHSYFENCIHNYWATHHVSMFVTYKTGNMSSPFPVSIPSITYHKYRAIKTHTINSLKRVNSSSVNW